MARVISKEKLNELVLDLAKKEVVIAPVLAHPHSHASQFVFKKLKGKEKIEWHYPTTVLPPKEFLFPSPETLFSFNENIAKPDLPESQILFGVNLEDLEGINLLAKYFASPVKDEVFESRIEKTTVVGIDRFSPPKNLHYDLYLMEYLPGQFAAFSKTKKGTEITKSSYFNSKNIKLPSVKKKKDRILENKNLSAAMEASVGHPVWKELAEICFGCGICTYACPVCYCFNTYDEKEIGTETGKRCRNWDSCMLAGFAKTSGEDFRPELEKRIYNWYFHKFVRSEKEYGEVGCVDCNRCAIFCPAHIDYKRVLARVLKDYENEKL